jgi:LysR family glycine cleavage system transcriptional activator
MQQGVLREIDAGHGPSFDTLDLATNAALQGFGVAISDLALVDEDVAARRLVRPFDTVLTTGSRYYFVYPDCVAHQQKVNLFREWIAEHWTERAGGGNRPPPPA